MVQTSGGRSCLNMPVLRPLDTSSGWDGSLPFGRVLIRLCVCVWFPYPPNWLLRGIYIGTMKALLSSGVAATPQVQRYDMPAR